MNQEHNKLIVETLVAGTFIGPDEVDDALEILKEATDSETFMKTLFDDIIALPERRSATEMLMKDEKIRKALHPDIHIHLLKFLIGQGMGYGKEEQLKMVEVNIRESVKSVKNFNDLVKIPAKKTYQEI